MQATILQENLYKGLSLVSRFVSSRSQLPTLSGILFVCQKEGIKLSATDLETGINYWLSGKVEKEGKIVLPAKTILELISSLPPDKIFLKEENGKIKILCRNYQAIIKPFPSDDFPQIPSIQDFKKTKKEKELLFNRDSFLKAINKVYFATSQDDSRPTLTGVKLEFLNKGIRMVATDGYRLSMEFLKGKNSFVKESLIIPGKILMEVAKIGGILGEESIKGFFSDEKKQIIFSFSCLEVVGRLIEGEFPNFEKIIPTQNKTTIKVSKEDLQQAIKATSLFAREGGNILKFKIKGEMMVVSARASEVGENEVKIHIKKEGEDVEIAFNWRFLQDVLGVLEGEELVLGFSGSLSPGVFKDNKDEGFLHLVMPVRVQE